MGNADYNILTFEFFRSQGITDDIDIMRCQTLCIQIKAFEELATVEMVKNSMVFKCCMYDIPAHLITDEKIQEMIDFDC